MATASSGVAVGSTTGSGSGVSVGSITGSGVFLAVGSGSTVGVSVGSTTGSGVAVAVGSTTGSDVAVAVGSGSGVGTGSGVAVGAASASGVGVSSGSGVGTGSGVTVGSTVAVAVGSTVAVAVGSSPSAETGVAVSSRPPGILTPPATRVAMMSLTVRPAGLGSFSPGTGGGLVGVALSRSIDVVLKMKSLRPVGPASRAIRAAGWSLTSMRVVMRPCVISTRSRWASFTIDRKSSSVCSTRDRFTSKFSGELLRSTVCFNRLTTTTSPSSLSWTSQRPTMSHAKAPRSLGPPRENIHSTPSMPVARKLSTPTFHRSAPQAGSSPEILHG